MAKMTRRQKRIVNRDLSKRKAEALAALAVAASSLAPTLDAVEEAARPKQPTYTYAEVKELIDRDRVAGFMIFVRAMPPDFNGQVFGTAEQVRSIARELEKLGY